MSGPTATPPGKSAPGGEADAIRAKADIDTRRSAVGGRADVLATWPESPVVANTRHSQGLPKRGQTAKHRGIGWLRTGCDAPGGGTMVRCP